MLMLWQVMLNMKRGLKDAPYTGKCRELDITAVQLREVDEIHCINGEGANGTSHANPLRNLTTPSFCPQNDTYH